MKILSIDPGKTRVGYAITEKNILISSGVIQYKKCKNDLIWLINQFKVNLCLIEKGSIPHEESKIKRIINEKKIECETHVSADVRQKLNLFRLGMNNSVKSEIISNHLFIMINGKIAPCIQYNSDVIDACLLAIYYNIITKEQKGELKWTEEKTMA